MTFLFFFRKTTLFPDRDYPGFSLQLHIHARDGLRPRSVLLDLVTKFVCGPKCPDRMLGIS